MKELKNWLEENLLNYKILSDNTFEITKVGKFLLVEEKEIIIDEAMNLMLSDEEFDAKTDFYCYKFGSNFYYIKKAKKLIIKEFSILKYLGEAKIDFISEFPSLSVHGGYDILNGSRSYKDWCRKAKFIGTKTLAITEKNTLGGLIKFQEACKESNIKPILGGQYSVKHGDKFYLIKCYIKDERGWGSILMINKEVNVINNKFIDKKRLLELTDGLILVIDPKHTDESEIFIFDLQMPKGDLFYQLDDVEFDNDNTDKDYLLNLKKFIEQETIPPILISDAYYLDKDESRAKEILNNIADNREFKSNNQYFKTLNDIFDGLSLLFADSDTYLDLFEKALKNTIQVANRCNFTIPTGLKLLPNYIMTEKEKQEHKTNENLFLSIIQEGIEKKLADKPNLEEYYDRIEQEYPVIVNNGFVDYFLILWDIINWSRENGILTGVGRGSSGGCLIAFCMNITEIDPIPFGLLFERFLTNERARMSLPDIDVDFEGLRRNDVKRYMEERYGKDNVCSVGTYTNLKLKQSFKDLSKLDGVTFGTANYISQVFDIEEGDWSDVFKTAGLKPLVKEFVLENPGVIEDMRLILNQPKSRSIHACATIIVPQGKDIYNSIPVRLEQKGDEPIIVSEWEGGELETAGYLKEDILGVKQLDKYRFIIDLIKKTKGIDIDIYNIPLDITPVYELFQEGMNSDIFQFGTPGLTAYCKQIKPERIDDLIAACALFRPGPMDVNSHNEYVLRKNGERSVEYRWMMKEITANTYGLIVYQEQVMKIFNVLADFTLEESDTVRKSMGKKSKHIMDKLKDRFISKCIEKGCPSTEAKEIWHEIEVHARYSFGLSHSTVYAIAGYIGQCLKHYYPLQFWTAAFEFDDDNEKKSNVNRYIGEINKSSNGIKLMPPNINESGEQFTSNFNKNEIYWSIGRVKQVGEKALEAIIKERDENGEFFSFKEFLDRVNKRVVNKAVIANLAFAGAFDELCEVNKIQHRQDVIENYYKIQKTKDKDKLDFSNCDKFWWQLKQKEVCGFGNIDFIYVIRNHTDFKISEYIDGFELQGGEYERSTVTIAGIITNVIERSSKKIGLYCALELDCNHEKINVTVWSDIYESNKSLFEIGKIIVMDGMVKYDSYKNVFAVQTFPETKIFVI